jgi:hypothetical protein
VTQFYVEVIQRTLEEASVILIDANDAAAAEKPMGFCSPPRRQAPERDSAEHGDTSVADIVFRLVDWLAIAVSDGHLKTMLAKFLRAPNGCFSCFEFACVCGSSPCEDSTDNEHHPSPKSFKEKPREGGGSCV